MTKHLLIYDFDWWILGKHANLIQKYHPYLDIISMSELDEYIRKRSSEELNRAYEHISALCLGIAAYSLFKGVRVDSAAAVSYYYFSQNYDTFREWTDPLIPDPEFLRLVLSRIKTIGAMNHRLTSTLRKLAPASSVQYIGHFVDERQFNPSKGPLEQGDPFTIGWAGDKAKQSKNYNTLFRKIKASFEYDDRVRFIEASGNYAHVDMPKYYHKLDMLLITASNEGSGATALEAYASGVPVLSTDVGNVKSAAHPAAHHLVLDSDEPKPFIDAIHAALECRASLRSLGLQCRAWIEKEWSLEEGIARWLSVLFPDLDIPERGEGNV